MIEPPDRCATSIHALPRHRLDGRAPFPTILASEAPTQRRADLVDPVVDPVRSIPVAAPCPTRGAFPTVIRSQS